MSSILERETRRGRAARAGALAAAPAGFGAWPAGLLAMNRVQLAGGAVAGLLVPALLHDWSGARPSPTLLASAAALVLGYVAMRRMRSHPGVHAFGYVVYAFALAYAAAGIVLLLAGADVSRGPLVLSFGLSTAWFVAADRLARKGASWRLGYLPGAAPAALPRAPWVTWRRLDDPRADLGGLTGVVADLSAGVDPEWEQFLARCALQGLAVYDVRQVAERLTGKLRLEHLSENTLSSDLAHTAYARVKRLADLAAVILAAPLALPVTALAALAVKLESPGPALFRQVRTGHRGRPFVIWKLRTMRAEPGPGQSFTEDNDGRITRVGAVLRKYRVDELPQLWNILKGEMSWIGPRPEAAPLAQWYERETPFYCYRHMVRPGITGWAQVNQGNVAGPAAATEKLHYDFYYIKNLSPWLDLLIAAKTVRTVLTGFGSK